MQDWLVDAVNFNERINGSDRCAEVPDARRPVSVDGRNIYRLCVDDAETGDMRLGGANLDLTRMWGWQMSRHCSFQKCWEQLQWISLNYCLEGVDMKQGALQQWSRQLPLAAVL
jgi:hypothetical protein